MDITPRVPAGRSLIQGYGGGGFRISGVRVAGSRLVFPERNLPWDVTDVDAITIASLSEVVAGAEPVSILLIGCGQEGRRPNPAIAEAMREHGVVVEWMATGAACRTFNVLIGEERPVAAALIAVD
ncbi:MAG: hypothetical protein EA406_03375 [Rhodospirillales bacterium]|nr:MAG: hypothetical protein EA406_03375 [Rhodospirillales bacterium]